MGNGFPVSAVVTRKEIADALGGKVEYFNTVILLSKITYLVISLELFPIKKALKFFQT